MIFVTVGTHEQQFDRLIKYVDDMKKNGKIKEEIIMQTGFSTYKPQYCTWERFIPYNKMEENIVNARIVITHGGPASFIMPLQIGKIPIVIPRQNKFDEHVNNHQVEFTTNIAERMGTIIPILDIKDLDKTIENYDLIIASMNCSINNNNAKFNQKFEIIIHDMF